MYLKYYLWYILQIASPPDPIAFPSPNERKNSPYGSQRNSQNTGRYFVSYVNLCFSSLDSSIIRPRTRFLQVPVILGVAQV